MWRTGEVVDDRYEVIRVHEHGGMGLVYRVRHLAWDIDLAVKSPRVLDGHEQGVGCLALTPDGRFLLTGKDNTLRLWELDWELSAQDTAGCVPRECGLNSTGWS